MGHLTDDDLVGILMLVRAVSHCYDSGDLTDTAQDSHFVVGVLRAAAAGTRFGRQFAVDPVSTVS